MGNEKNEARCKIALVAALVHDLGHGPFSHAFEGVGKKLNLKMAHHETVSDELIKNGEVANVLDSYMKGMSEEVADLIAGRSKKDIYSSVISSQFDADRLDYMQRDRLMTGTKAGAIDFEWLISNLKIGEISYGVDDIEVGSFQSLVLGPKAILAAETYVLGLFQLYPTIYFHKTTRCVEKMFEKLLLRLKVLVDEGHVDKTNLPQNHPLVAFFQNPESLEATLALDDTVVLGALSLVSDAKDLILSDIATRIRDRRLYKVIDIRTIIETKLRAKMASKKISLNSAENQRELARKIEAVCLITEEAIQEHIENGDKKFENILIDSGTRNPYKKSLSHVGGVNQIRVATNTKTTEDIGLHSAVIRATDPFKFLRSYYPDNDSNAKLSVEKVISECLKEVQV